MIRIKEITDFLDSKEMPYTFIGDQNSRFIAMFPLKISLPI